MNREAVIVLLALAVVLTVAFVLRWQRNWIILRTLPREILFLAGAAERNRVLGLGTLAFLKNWRTWVALIGYSIPLILLTAAMQELTLDAARTRGLTFAEVLVGMYLASGIGLVVIPLMFARYRKYMRVFLRKYLNDHGIPICQDCGYDLRGQVIPRCPECGVKVESP